MYNREIVERLEKIHKRVLQVTGVDVKTEKTIFCHNCKVNIKLSDNEASVKTGIDNMSNALKKLENTLILTGQSLNLNSTDKHNWGIFKD